MYAAITEAQAITSNKTVMAFLRQQALEKVAEEMQKTGYSCTAKGVDILTIKRKNIEERVQKYIAAGVVGCLMAKYQ